MDANQAPPAPEAVPTAVATSPDTPPPLPTAVIGTSITESAGVDLNAPMPPLLDKAGVPMAEAVGAGWVYNRVITHLWSYDSPVGAWAWIDGTGWKRLSPASQFGHTQMTVLATLATNRNLPVDYHEDAAGQIDQLLV
jgi:hypothetical protein